MKSKISFCNIEIIRNNLRMYSLLSLFWGIFLFVIYPLVILKSSEYTHVSEVSEYMFNSGVMLSLILPTSMGLVFFGFLKAENATAFYMSLPTTKTQIFISQYISAAILYLLPLYLNALLIFGFGSINMDRRELAIFLMKWVLAMTLFFVATFTVSAGIGMITGSVIWNILFVGAYYALPTFLGQSFDFFSSKLILGLPYSGRFTEWFRSIDIVMQSIDEMRHREPLSDHRFLSYLGLYALVVLSITALLYYKKKMENNKEWIVFTFFKFFFIAGFTLCTVFVIAMIFNEVIFRGSSGAIYVGAMVGAILGYIISAMIAFKTIYLKKYWLGTFVALGLTVGIIGMIDLDVFGLERRIPETEDIAFVVISHQGSRYQENEKLKLISFDGGYHYGEFRFEKPENIELVRNLQSKIIEDLQRNGHNDSSYRAVRFEYNLKNGKTLYRHYYDVNIAAYEKEYNAISMTEESLQQEYPILNPKYVEKVSRIRISTDLNNSEEVLTDEKKKQFLAIVQEELYDFVKNEEKPNILGDWKDRILLLEESPIRVVLEESASEMVGTKTEEVHEGKKAKATREIWESRIIFKGKAPKIRKWLRENSQFHSQMKLTADQVAKIDVYEVAGYEAYDIRNRHNWKEYTSYEVKKQVTDAKYYTKLIETSGEMAYDTNIGVILLDIHLKNGVSLPRVMRYEDFKKITEE